MVFTSYNMGYFHEGVVDRDREVVRRYIVASDDYKIPYVFAVERNMAVDRVFKLYFLFSGYNESGGGVYAFRDFASFDVPASSVVTRGFPGFQLALFKLCKPFQGAMAGICQFPVNQFPCIFNISPQATRLAERAEESANIRAFV